MMALSSTLNGIGSHNRGMTLSDSHFNKDSLAEVLKRDCSGSRVQ